MNNENAVIFARSNHGSERVQHQIDLLRAYAAAHGYRVLGTVGLSNTSANDLRVQASLTGLIAKSPSGAHSPTILVTDYSRLARGVERGLHLMERLRAGGWNVVSADGSGPIEGPIKLFRNGQKVLGEFDAKSKETGHPGNAEADDGH